MISVIDNLNSTVGWSSNASVTVSENENTDFVAGLRNSKSLLIHFPENSLDDYIEKTVSFDLSSFEEIVFHVWSRNFGSPPYRKVSDFYYKIDIGGGNEYLIPIDRTFNDITIRIEGIGSLSRIRITALTNNEDYLVMSYMVAVKDELPRDIFSACKDHIDKEIEDKHGDGILVGTLTGSSGDRFITVGGDNFFLDRYAAIRIEDGVNQEDHHIDNDRGNDTYDLGELLDGNQLLNTYAGANVRLLFPVNFGVDDSELIIPGITIWGMTAEPILRGSKLEDVIDTYLPDGSVKARREGQIYVWRLLIYVEARTNEPLALMSEAVRKFISKTKIWILGRKHDVSFEGEPTEVIPSAATDMIPQVQYTARIELKEERWSRISRVPITTTNITVNPLGEKIIVTPKN